MTPLRNKISRLETEILRLQARVGQLYGENSKLTERLIEAESKIEIPSDCVLREWNLTGQETRIAAILLRADGAIVTKPFLREALWRGSITALQARRNLGVQLHRLRGKLAPYGMTVQTVRGLGYFLERKDTPRFNISAQIKTLGADSLLP